MLWIINSYFHSVIKHAICYQKTVIKKNKPQIILLERKRFVMSVVCYLIKFRIIILLIKKENIEKGVRLIETTVPYIIIIVSLYGVLCIDSSSLKYQKDKQQGIKKRTWPLQCLNWRNGSSKIAISESRISKTKGHFKASDLSLSFVFFIFTTYPRFVKKHKPFYVITLWLHLFGHINRSMN